MAMEIKPDEIASILRERIEGLETDSADLTEVALRTVLFGEASTLADQHMDFATQIDDPLRPLRESPVSEEIVRSLSELLVTDVVVPLLTTA